MKTLIILGILGTVIMFALGFSAFSSPGGVGIALNSARFDASSVVGEQIDCSSANASTSVVAANPGRTSFIATNVGANTVYLCRHASICSATSGIPLFHSTSSLPRFEQEDGYRGAYICRAATATTSINVVRSQ